MGYLTSHWSYDPFLIVVAVIAAWHEIGLRGLALRSRPDRTRQRRLRSLWFYAGLAVLLVTVQSPIDYWPSSYFYVHMIQHLLLSFAAPVLVVAGAPWPPLMDALPAQWGKRLVRSVSLGRWSRPARAAGRAVAQPWVAVIAFNAAMIAWHVPVLYDLAERSGAVHVWLMHGSLFVTGVLFWLQFISSPPVRVRLRPAAQIAALTGTNVAMWFLAMSMSIFTTTSWYAVYAHVPGVTLPPFADQQIGAAILWVCGDFWCYPAVGLIIRRMIDRDGASATVDRILRSGHTRRPWPASGRITGQAPRPPGRGSPGRR